MTDPLCGVCQCERGGGGPTVVVSGLLACAEPDASALPQVTLESVTSIGVLSDPDYALSDVWGLTVGPAGDIYVLEMTASQVRVYNADGQYQRTIGREGEGPGEFVRPWALGFANDTLWVSHAFRVEFFTDQGAPIRSQTLSIRPPPPESGPGLVVLPPRARLASGAWIYETHHFSFETDPLPTSTPILRGAEGRVDTLAWLERDGPIEIRENRGQTQFAAPFAGDAQLAVSSNGDYLALATIGSSRVEVVRYSADGSPRDTLGFAFEPEPVALEFARALYEREYEGIWERMEEFQSRGLLRISEEIPTTAPPVTGLVVSDAGEVWVRREHQASDSVAWELLGRDGPVAQFAAHWSFSPRVIRDDLIYAADDGGSGIPRVRVFRIARPDHPT